jgi:cytoskeletal protein CcmA (bactofilin family)
VLIPLVALVSLYYARTSILTPIIQRYICTKTGYELKFDNLYISPFSLTLKNLKAGNIFASHKVTFKINPLKFFKHISSPIDCITKINISKLEIYLDKDANKKDSILNKVFIKLPASEVAVYADEVIIKKSDAETYNLLKIVGLDMLVCRDKIVLDSTFYIQDIPVKVNSQATRKTKSLFAISSLFCAKDKIDLCLCSKGTIDFSSLDISQNIEIKQMSYKGFDLGGALCSFLKYNDNYNADLTGDFGCFSFSSLGDGTTCVKSKVDISKINKEFAGSVQLKFNEQRNKGDIELNATNLTIFGNNFGNFKLLGLKNNDNIYNMSCTYGYDKKYDKKIEIVYTKGGKYEAKTGIPCIIKGDLKTGEIAVDINNANIGGASVSGYAQFQGHLDAENNIKGSIKGKSIKVAGMSLGNISADAVISTEKLKISNLKSGSDIKAQISANFKENELSGNIDLKNINVDGVYAGMSGYLNSHIKLSGQLNNPHVIISALGAKGKYLEQSFSLMSKLEYKEGIFKINNADFKLPFFEVGFSGNASLYEKNGAYYPKVFLKAKSAYVKNVKLNDVDFNIGFNDDKITISDSYARISNSEIRLDKGFFDIKDGNYALDLGLTNVHAGSADIFGKVSLSGRRTKENDEFTYNGNIGFDDFWINEHKFSSYFDYSLKDKTFEFFQKSGDIDKYSPSGVVVFRNIGSAESLDIEIRRTSIDWHFINNALNLPDVFDGKVNIDASFCGNISNPKGKLSLVSTNGSITGAPYDNCNIEMNLCNNHASINASINKPNNEIYIAVAGNFPLGFDKAATEIIRKDPIDIHYKIDDRKLNILKYLSNGNIKKSDGQMCLEGNISGTYENPTNNGNLSIAGGLFESKVYFNKKVEDMSTEISLDENIIKINKFSFKSGSGKLNAFGKIKLKKFGIDNFDINISTDKNGIPLSIPQLPITTTASKFMGSHLQEYSSGNPVFKNIKIQGTTLCPKISGRIELKNTRFNFDPDKNEKLENSYIPENTEFNLELASDKNTRFENSYVSSLIKGLVHIKGTYDNIKVDGTVEALKGKVTYYGMYFDILHAKVEIIEGDIFEGNQVYVTAEAVAEGKTIIDPRAVDNTKPVRLIIPRTKISELFPKFGPTSITSDNNLNANMQGKEAEKYIKQTAEKYIKQVVGSALLNGVHDGVVTLLKKTGTGIDEFVKHIDFGFSFTGSGTTLNDKDSALSNALIGARCSCGLNVTDDIIFRGAWDVGKAGIDKEAGVDYKFTNTFFLGLGYKWMVNKPNGLEMKLSFKPTNSMLFSIGSKWESKSSIKPNDININVVWGFRFC